MLAPHSDPTGVHFIFGRFTAYICRLELKKKKKRRKELKGGKLLLVAMTNHLLPIMSAKVIFHVY